MLLYQLVKREPLALKRFHILVALLSNECLVIATLYFRIDFKEHFLVYVRSSRLKMPLRLLDDLFTSE